MSVKHYKNGQLTLIAGSGGGGGEESFTGTKAEVEQAIAAGQIKENWTVYITDDIEEVIPGEVEIDTLDSYEEIMANTEEGKVAGALGIKEGFEKINTLDNYDEIMANTENDKIAGALGVKEGFEKIISNSTPITLDKSLFTPASGVTVNSTSIRKIDKDIYLSLNLSLSSNVQEMVIGTIDNSILPITPIISNCYTYTGGKYYLGFLLYRDTNNLRVCMSTATNAISIMAHWKIA